MKHFFFKNEGSDRILINLFDKDGNKSISDIKPISILREELLSAKNKENSADRISVNNTVLEQFKKIYDAADIIYDKRFDKDDSSDSNSENRTKNVDHELDRFNYKYGNDLPLRERALMSLWDYAENELSGSKYELEGVLAVYSCVARGNICLRLSNIYFDNYNLIESDKWGNRANEILWQGKNIINNHKNRMIPNGLDCTQNDILILDWLVSFNLAKYYRDYASRNRRSDYLSAVRLLDEIKFDIENRIACFQDKESEQARQCGMLYAETIRNDITISKRRNIKGGERKALYFARVLFDDCGITDEELVKDLDNEFKISDCFDKKDMRATNNGTDAFLNSINNVYINKEIINLIKGYSRERMLLLALLILARCLRGMHESEMYKKAIGIADIANRVSQYMDKTQNVNIDALIIISNCLRKYCIYADNNDDMSNDDMMEIVLRKDSEKRTLKDLFIELKAFADSRHLMSKTELVKWYCMLFEDRKRYQLGYLSAIVTWENFPDKEYIMNLLNTPSKNALLEFYRGKMLLDTSYYSEAEKAFTDLIDPNKEYNSVTYYIRTGSIGLKIRYLLANTYMAQGKYYQAKCILEEINNSLKSVKQLTEKETEENQYEDVYTDLRVLIDLAYCNIKRGDYTAAFNLYDNYYEISKKIIKSHIIDDAFLNKLPKYKRIAGINNLITCCLLNSEESKRKYGRDLLDEIDELDNYNYSIRVSDFYYNPETNLLRGLREVLNKNYKGAHEFFSRSCQKEIYYKPQYFSNEINETNLGALYNNVEYISAYLINLLKLYESPKYKEESEAEIKSFIEGLPNNRMLSLKAAIALANWLLSYNYDKEEESDRLFRYFSYIKIYEERGAGTFNKLDKKNNGKYRLYRSVERGKILARLLALYKPINNLKEMCTFSLRDYESISRRNPVHYTTIKALKGIIGEGNESFFRLSNCGNANDVYEGRIFFECLKNAVLKAGEDLPYSSKYIDQNDPADMESIVLETGSDVYIASFSQNRDSFPMWTIYSQEETGCNIEFGEGFFDIFGDVSEYDDLALLNDYLPSYYMDQDYPLYTIQYIKNEGKELRNVTMSTNQIQMDTVNELLLQIDKKWHELYSLLQGFNSVFQSESDSQTCSDAYTGGMDTVLSVAADLVNEVRFLFKNSDFSYESEARIVYTETNATPKTDYQREIPVTYVNMNRNIGEINVTLGSKLSYSDIDKIETWLMRTGHVDKVEVTETNRLKNSRKHKSN